MITSIEFFINIKEELLSRGGRGRGIFILRQYSNMMLTGIIILYNVVVHTAGYI